ncbi:MAG TPA: hypothetical protein DD670_02920, partial [Planctomycetaceae bacterium]|nr:hypothetical protein [Planctomycetaceae bacterium]
MSAVMRAQNINKTGQTRVLIVEDDRDQAEGLADLLESRGYASAVVHAVAAAREAFDKFDPQVALIDLRLGDESGMDLVRELREARPDLLCVVVTAHADLDNTVRSVQYRVFDFLRKPLAPATLLACLDRCAEQISLRDAKREAEEALRRSTKQLKRFNRLAVGREQRIRELKREVNELCRTLGKAEPFDSTALAADDSEPVPVETFPGREPLADAAPTTIELAKIVDLERVRSILDGFCDSVGIAAAIVDLRGEVLVRSRWQPICTDYHRVHDATRRGCIESDTELSVQLAEGRQYV